MSKDIGIVISDGHGGSTLGLIPVGGATLDDGQVVKPSPAQDWLNEQFLAFQKEVTHYYRRGDRVHCFVVGDALDNIWKSTQIWSRNDEDIIRAGQEIYGPFFDLATHGRFFLRGTPIHTGKAGALEESLAVRLDATRWPADNPARSRYELQINLQGVRIHLAHHGQAGRLEWTKTNPAGKIAVTAVYNAYRNGKLPPHVIYRAHTHRDYDSHSDYAVRVVNTPAWQLATEFGHRIAPGEDLTIGGCIFRVEDGHFENDIIRYFTQEEELWQPSTESQTPASAILSRRSKPSPAKKTTTGIEPLKS